MASSLFLPTNAPSRLPGFAPISRLSSSTRCWRGVLRAAAAQPTSPAAQQHAQQRLPRSFRRLVARRTGESFREVAEVEEAEMPTPGEGEVLIRVKYAGVNGGCETFRARGEHAFARNRKLPWFPLGAEGAGEVVALGPGAGAEGTGLAVGQAVTFVGSAFAEYVVAKAAFCWPVAAATPEAVALTISGTVAATALHAVAGLRQGETLLVTAAAGATGHFAAQLGLLAGCRVVATCGGARKAERLRGLGVHRVIDHTTEDAAEVLCTEFPGGVDVAYEGVGGALQRAALGSLAPGGRLLQVGYISEYPHVHSSGSGGGGSSSGENSGSEGEADGQAPGAAALPPNAELFWRGLEVPLGGGRMAYGQVWPRDRADTLRCKARVFGLHAAGELQAWVDGSASFEGVGSAPDAVEHMLSGRCIGKVVVKL